MMRVVVLTLVLCSQASTCEAQCDADYGASAVCCDQQAAIAAKEPGRKVEKPCPEETPTCVGFVYGSTFGTCQAGDTTPQESTDTSGTDTSTEATGANTKSETKPQSEAERKAERCRRNWVSAKDCDKWVADQLARKAARKADEDPAILKKEDEERDREDAERDAKQKEEDRKRDEEDKKRDEEDKKRDEEERKADDSDPGSSGAKMSPLTLSVLSLSAEDTDSDAWQKDLSADQRTALQQELAHLHHKSIKEQEIASQDGPGASEAMRQEYIQKTKATIAKFKEKAKAAIDAKADSSPADAKTSQGKANDSDVPAETISLSTAGHFTDKVPLQSIVVPAAFALFAYFALSALRPRDSQQTIALLKHASPV